MLIKTRFLDACILVFIVLSTYNPTLGFIFLTRISRIQLKVSIYYVIVFAFVPKELSISLLSKYVKNSLKHSCNTVKLIEYITLAPLFFDETSSAFRRISKCLVIAGFDILK